MLGLTLIHYKLACQHLDQIKFETTLSLTILLQYSTTRFKNELYSIAHLVQVIYFVLHILVMSILPAIGQ